MENQKVKDLFSSLGIEFSFPNLKNIAESSVTYPQFLGIVAQRILLKQYAAQSVDTKNLLSPFIRVSSLFDENKTKFSESLKEIKLEKGYISLINSQTSRNKLSKDDQSAVAQSFISWYEKNWFTRLKSEALLNSLVKSFSDADLKEISGGGDWEKLYQIYSQIDTSDWLESVGFDTKIFINDSKAVDPKWFGDSIKTCIQFMELSGGVSIQGLDSFILNEDLITPTVSSFMISTLIGIEEIENGKMKYNPPFDTYELFSVFKSSVPGQLMKANQFLFTLYKYFKIIA